MVYHYSADKHRKPVACDDPSAQKWVKLHVDLLFTDTRKSISIIVNGTNLGGHLSVCFPEGKLPIIKVGKDEVMFQMYQMNHSTWEMDGLI